MVAGRDGAVTAADRLSTHIARTSRKDHPVVVVAFSVGLRGRLAAVESISDPRQLKFDALRPARGPLR